MKKSILVQAHRLLYAFLICVFQCFGDQNLMSIKDFRIVDTSPNMIYPYAVKFMEPKDFIGKSADAKVMISDSESSSKSSKIKTFQPIAKAKIFAEQTTKDATELLCIFLKKNNSITNMVQEKLQYKLKKMLDRLGISFSLDVSKLKKSEYIKERKDSEYYRDKSASFVKVQNKLILTHIDGRVFTYTINPEDLDNILEKIEVITAKDTDSNDQIQKTMKKTILIKFDTIHTGSSYYSIDVLYSLQGKTVYYCTFSESRYDVEANNNKLSAIYNNFDNGITVSEHINTKTGEIIQQEMHYFLELHGKNGEKIGERNAYFYREDSADSIMLDTTEYVREHISSDIGSNSVSNNHSNIDFNRANVVGHTTMYPGPYYYVVNKDTADSDKLPKKVKKTIMTMLKNGDMIDTIEDYDGNIFIITKDKNNKVLSMNADKVNLDVAKTCSANTGDLKADGAKASDRKTIASKSSVLKADGTTKDIEKTSKSKDNTYALFKFACYTDDYNIPYLFSFESIKVTKNGIEYKEHERKIYNHADIDRYTEDKITHLFQKKDGKKRWDIIERI